MSHSATRIANDEQRAASDPYVSAFVGASAGSGKTTLLVNRLLRLMLADVHPGRILCLTYTRAAAAEMAIRLRRVLGEWVAKPDAELDKALGDLGEAPTAALRDKARRLFATVLDLPGGMRIETIHAFCQSLLRRFPLEASLSPHFRLIEETDAGAALSEAREAVLGAAERQRLEDALRLLAGEVSANDFASLVRTLGKRPDDAIAAAALPPEALMARLRAALGVQAADEAALIAQGVLIPDEAGFRQALQRLATVGSAGDKARAAAALDWLARDPASRAAAWDAWLDVFLTDGGKTGRRSPRAPGGLVAGKAAKAEPGLTDAMLAQQEHVCGIEDQQRGLKVAEFCAALVRLAAPMLEDYGSRKRRTGLLDYDDLIARSERLLANPGAAWVLYKLDGGIDHVLLDEVQDTAPAQWRIANALTGEFFAGAGAREDGADAGQRPGRSVFAVGDRKQSIYSFQGADADAFDTERARLAARVKAGGARWLDGRLDVSFRSAVPVLALVDAVFAQPGAAPGVVERDAGGALVPLRHIAARAGAAGAVELWPLAPQPP
ncbi:MAG: UvrD-helicase domain-containing protein, partial [Proteobacteria bacterium]|nr:UvrD-helicase domain-containing protein [Pseudomonadota bacterium]